MNTVFFFYTLIILIIYIVTAVLALAAYASSRRIIFVYASGAFICYALEIIEIFFYEYTLQNQTFDIATYYEITMPVIRTLVAVLSQGFIWAAALEILDKHSKKLFAIPLVAFLVANIAVLDFMPYGPVRQWLYYTLRQVFLFGAIGYAVFCYRTSKDKNYRARLAPQVKYLVIAVVFLVAVLLEDIFNILIVPASDTPSWLLLYISERNISENLMACYLAALVITYAMKLLSIRIKEVPEETEVPDLERHIDEQMDFFLADNKLSKREAEVLRLIVQGKNNQEISQELFLAIGTVKAHVHNIMVKTNCKTRDDLVVYFWTGR